MALRAAFARGERLPRPVAPPILAGDFPAIAATYNLSVRGTGETAQTLVLAYDTGVAAVRWFGKALPPLWTQHYPTATAMAQAALEQQANTRAAAEAFDQREMAKYRQLGGQKFAAILSLAYRQAYGSTILVWNAATSTHWQFLKEMSDNDLSTMDVIIHSSSSSSNIEPPE